MSNLKFRNKMELLEYAEKSIGVPIKTYDLSNRLVTGKGAIGTIMEEGYFGYRPNSKSEADFIELGIELKVTPFKRTSKGIRSKERLVCNIIDYMKEYKATFETSSFMKKCSLILIMLYEHVDNVFKGDFFIDKAFLFSFPEEDLLIIEDDWYKIISKIKAGKAHEISESDTLYLGACTKGANSKSLRKQPFSDVLAMQRAYSLKTSYMTYILNEYIYGAKTSESIIKYPSILRDTTFENIILSQMNPHFGKSVSSLCAEFAITKTSKNLNEIIVSRILGIHGRVSKTSEFKKANIVPKTIRIRHDGHIVESMSFPSFKFMDLVNQEWEDSELYECFTQTKFMFIVFKENVDGMLYLEKIIFWNMPQSDLEDVRIVWERTKEVIKNGVEIKRLGTKNTNNFPKSSDNRVAHVRPHAKDSFDTYPLPDGRLMTKQCFWLNNSYVKNEIVT